MVMTSPEPIQPERQSAPALDPRAFRALFLPALQQCLEGLSLTLPDGAEERLLRFALMVADANRRLNLTRITDPVEMAVKHFADSLSVLLAALPPEAAVADIGCGAGFPGIPLAIARPDLRLTLVDSTGKKVAFAASALEALGLSACRAVTGRGEEMGRDERWRETQDVVVWRGLGELSLSAELCLPLVRRGGLGIAMKGPKLAEELAAARPIIGELGCRVDGEVPVPLPGGLEHRLLLLRRAKPTPARFPRPYAKLKKR